MPWCPVCKQEYRPEFHSCTSCNVELVNAIPPDIVETEPQQQINMTEKWILLTEITTENEVTIIESFLQSHEIPVVKQLKGNGEMLKLYTGVTNDGIEIFVPASQEQRAKGLLERVATPIYNVSHKVEPEQNNKKRRVMMGILLGCFCIPLLAFLGVKLLEILP